MRHFTEWLRQAYDRVVKQRPKERDDRGYAAVPPASRVSNRLSGQAMFAPCARRRVGYMAHVEAAKFAELKPDEVISLGRKAWMEDAWHRGVTWMPLLVEAEVMEDRWVINRIKDFDVAHFLAHRQKLLVVQVFEKDHSSGTEAKLHLLKEKGLFLRSGEHCPIVFARVTY